MSKLSLPTIGWREKIALPQLGISAVKAKIDTGARSCALHAFDIETFERDGKQLISFKVHPYQRDTDYTVTAQAQLLEYREVKNSGGQAELRPVIETIVELGNQQWLVELTLTNRDLMGFRMLLGRRALRRRFLINPGKSFLQSHYHQLKNTHELAEEL